ncbi:hypothetical protein ACFUV1_08730 [Streptomyces griseoincarnatus]
MAIVTEKSTRLYGCRLGSTAIRQLARIASEGIEGAQVRFSHTHDSSQFDANNLEELVQLIRDSPVVSDMADCKNLTISVTAPGISGVFNYFSLSSEYVHVLFRGPDREATLGKFETAIGYLKGHGGSDLSPNSALRPFYYMILAGVILQALVWAVAKGNPEHPLMGAGSIVSVVCYFIAWRVKSEIFRRRENVINAIDEPQDIQRGWPGLSVANKISVIAAILAAIAAAGTVASAVADWSK